MTNAERIAPRDPATITRVTFRHKPAGSDTQAADVRRAREDTNSPETVGHEVHKGHNKARSAGAVGKAAGKNDPCDRSADGTVKAWPPMNPYLVRLPHFFPRARLTAATIRVSSGITYSSMGLLYGMGTSSAPTRWMGASRKSKASS